MQVDADREKRASPDPMRGTSPGKKKKEEDPADANTFNQRLEDEEDKRRDLKFKIEDIQDDMASLRVQNEKFRYNASRLTELVLKMADLEQGTNVTLVKKKELSMKELFGKWVSFQTVYGNKPEVVLIGNCGPVWQVRIKCQSQCQSIFDSIKPWAEKEFGGSKCAIFRGKAAATNMAESPVQLIRNIILRQLGISPQAARDNGIRTNWPDLKKQRSVT